DLLHNRYARRNLLVSYGLILAIIFTPMRLALLALVPTTECYELLIGFFYGMANNRVLVLSAATMGFEVFFLGRNHLAALTKWYSSNRENQTPVSHTGIFLLRA